MLPGGARVDPISRTSNFDNLRPFWGALPRDRLFEEAIEGLCSQFPLSSPDSAASSSARLAPRRPCRCGGHQGRLRSLLGRGLSPGGRHGGSVLPLVGDHLQPRPPGSCDAT